MSMTEKWATKIAKLLAMSDDPNIGAEERDAFLSKANKLMREYKIEWAKIQEAKGRFFQDVDKLETVWGPVWPKGEDAAWRRGVFGAIARLMYCEALIAASGDNGGRAVIIGTKTDIGIALQVFDRVITWLERDAVRAYLVANIAGEIKHVGKVNAYNWRMAFKAAAAVSVSDRVAEMLIDRDNDPETKAIVVVTRNQIQEYIDENYRVNKATDDLDSIAKRATDDAFRKAAARGYQSGRDVPITHELRKGNDEGSSGGNT